MKSALILGSRGQDGVLLTELLLKSGYNVWGWHRAGIDFWSGQTEPELRPAVDLYDFSEVCRVLQEAVPHEVYYLVGHHHSSQTGDLESSSQDVVEKAEASHKAHVVGLLHVLEGLRSIRPATKVFYASSCMVFGSPGGSPQDESFALQPDTIYGQSKAAGQLLCGLYRRSHGMFVSVGILYNHESSLRGPDFLSKKVVSAAVRAKRGLPTPLVVGNLSQKVDWGSADDFVRAFQLVLQADSPDDFVIATGEVHSVAELAEVAFGEVGLDWKSYVQENARVLQRVRGATHGNPKRLQGATGWRPEVSFRDLIQRMVRVEEQRIGK